MDLLHAHRVSPKKALLLPAQSVRYPDLFTTFTPFVRKSAELAKCISRQWHSAIKKRTFYRFFFNGGVDVARFELFKKYYEHLKSKHTQKVCLFIRTLE